MQYARWRTPDGKLHPSKDDFAPKELLKKLGEESVVAEDGSVQWRTSMFFQLQLVVQSSIGILQIDGKELNEADSNSMIERALHDVAKASGTGNPISPKKLLDAVQSKAVKFFRGPPQSYSLITSLSLKNIGAISTDVFGTTITSVCRDQFPFPVSLRNGRSFLAQHVEGTKYTVLAATCDALSVNDAIHRAMSAVEILRGVWSFIYRFGVMTTSWYTSPKRQWIGQIHTGPVHLLYDNANNKLFDEYLYDSAYTEDAELFEPSRGGWSSLEQLRSEVFAKISALPYKDDLLLIFERYAQALHQPNLDVAFLQLWGLIEKITDTIGANYDETVSRAIWPLRPREVVKPLLNMMRTHRNRFVHAGNSPNERVELCQVAKMVVDYHVDLLVNNAYQVSSLHEYGEFLKLPVAEQTLRDRKAQYELALKLKYPMSVPSNTEPDENKEVVP